MASNRHRTPGFCHGRRWSAAQAHGGNARGEAGYTVIQTNQTKSESLEEKAATFSRAAISIHGGPQYG